MKRYGIVKNLIRTSNNETYEEVYPWTEDDEMIKTVFTEDNMTVAIELVNSMNKKITDRKFKYELVELVSLVETKVQQDMSEEELREYNKTISDIYTDLQNNIDFDEWAAREYGETRIDYLYSAKNLYDAGYRKITKVEE